MCERARTKRDGFAPLIRVSTRKHGNQVAVRIQDNGVGIPGDLNIEQTATLGLQLVWLLAEQLKANVTIQRSNPTRFELRLPLHPQ